MQLLPEKIGWSSVASRATMVAAEPRSRSAFEDTVRIYRHDSADEPYLWNVDRLTVVDLRRAPGLEAWASAASTQLNENLRAFAEAYIFWIVEEPPADHHHRDQPSTLTVQIEGLGHHG